VSVLEWIRRFFRRWRTPPKAEYTLPEIDLAPLKRSVRDPYYLTPKQRAARKKRRRVVRESRRRNWSS